MSTQPDQDAGVVVSVYLPRDIEQAARRRAEDSDRSFSRELRRALKKHLADKDGGTPSPGSAAAKSPSGLATRET